MALTRGELDKSSCMNPHCDHKSHSGGLVLSGRCHVGKPTRAIYVNGVIRIICSVCEKLVVEVAVET